MADKFIVYLVAADLMGFSGVSTAAAVPQV